ncbi:MAG TPA: UTP--glucose-1-phosphate uridylyltransferase [Candidatus Binataceae bacterium]|nr:UTP--glucose-1-phosphate uridylyltransferase [Candidatus Binataceae bacterium]
MKVSKAVIVAAGLGTRMLPASKAVPKEILPILDRPAIQLVVEEAVAAGIRDIVLIVSPGRTTVLDHFGPAPELERHLAARGKHEMLAQIRKIGALAKFTAVEQEQPLGLGHAVLQARRAVGGEPFAVMLPDDIFDCPRPCLGQMLAMAERLDAPVVALLKVAKSEVSKYGIVSGDRIEERLYRLTGMVEKPAPEKAPSELAIVGRYVLPPEIFEILAHGRPGAGGEIQLTDALIELARRRPLYGYEFEGTRYDIGDPLGFLTAQIGFGLKHPDFADSFRAYLRMIVSAL